MRIGMIVDVYKPHVSGITNHVALNKRYFEAAGHEVYVFTLGDRDCEDDEPNVVRSPGLPLVDSDYYINTRYNLQAQRILRTMDVVHVHQPFISGRLALRYCQPRGIPIVYTNHTRYDLYAYTYFPILPESVSDSFLRAYLPSFCGSCDMVIAPSHGMRKVLRDFGVETHVEVVPNGVDLTLFYCSVESVDRVSMGFGENDIVLVYSGRLGPEKNLPFLLRAFAGTAKTYDNVCLLVVGGGPELDNLQDRVQHMGITDRVHFTGMVPYEEMPRYLATADAFVTASVSEVHPLSVIEAFAAGLPVLGIQSPGVGDIVEDGVTGIIAPEDDLAVFTAKMVRLVTSEGSLEKMSVQAREAASKYAIEQTSQILLDHYRSQIVEAAGRERSPRQRLMLFIDDLVK